MKYLAWFMFGLGLAGCARPTPFDRTLDARDVFTVTYGKGLGCKARIGPVNAAPLLVVNDVGGLRGGVWFKTDRGRPFLGDYGVDDGGLFFLGAEVFAHPVYHDHWRHEPALELVKLRGKSFETDSWLPALSMPRLNLPGSPFAKYPFYYFAQFEIVMALGRSIRLGFNPGELLDYLLGWVGLDIMRDNIGAMPAGTKSQAYDHK